MRVLVAVLAVLALASANSVLDASTTGTVAWGAATWTGGISTDLVPLATDIDAMCTITTDSAMSTLAFTLKRATLSLGGTFTTASAALSDGATIQANSNSIVFGPASTVTASNVTIVGGGGLISQGAAGTFTVQPNTWLELNGVNLASGLSVSAGASLKAKNTVKLTLAQSLTGAGTIWVPGTLQVAASSSLSTQLNVAGTLSVDADKTLTLAAGASAWVSGSVMAAAATSAPAVVIGADTGAAVALHFTGSAATAANAMFNVKSMGTLAVDQGATLTVSGSSGMVTGTGVVAVNGIVSSSAALTLQTATAVSTTGQIVLTGTAGSLAINGGATLSVNGGTLKNTGTASSSIVVGEDAGANSKTGAIVFASVNEGLSQDCVYDVKSTGKVIVSSGSALHVLNSLKIAGEGSLVVQASGSFLAAASTDVAVDATIDGSLVFSPAVSASFDAVTLSSTSFVTFEASATGFSVVKFRGNLVLDGTVTVELNKFTTTTRVKIATVSPGFSITGRFATQRLNKQEAGSPVARRLLAKAAGAVVQDGNDLYYDPNAVPPKSAASTRAGSPLAALLLAAAAAVFVALRR